MVMSMGLIITSRVLLNTRDVFAQVINFIYKFIVLSNLVPNFFHVIYIIYNRCHGTENEY